MDMNSENWEAATPLPDMEAELKKIRRDIRKRNWKVVLTSLVLVAALLVGIVKIGIPVWEAQYWDPTTCTYLENITDLELTMNVYNELFGHGKHFVDVNIQKRGFADYALDVIFAEYETMTRLTDVSYRSASLTRGELQCPSNFWLDIIPGIFQHSNTKSAERRAESHRKYVSATLNELPEYVEVYASVTFPEDLTMDALLQLEDQYKEDSCFLWAILRCNDASDDYIPQCGVHLQDYRSDYYQPAAWADTAYPDLFTDRYNWTGSIMEQHITSMLQFSADQARNGTGIVPSGETPEYYQTVLDYFEENGIKTYGCYVIASPQTLLGMMDHGDVSDVSLIDAWIGF